MDSGRILWRNILIAGLTLGTAWAVRGQFGHEQGAAWAGGLGGMIILLLAKRDDWHQHFLFSAMAAAIGWGVGGMISYGIVVGYARALDFVNVAYGLESLLLIGSLYGFLGGGLFGLSLESKIANWGKAIVAMVVGAIVAYWFIIEQLGWTMTPPRSEAWAGTLGMVIGLYWFLRANGFHRSIHVALCSAVGGGFGFAFGNFLQVLGIASEISFNFWNVMEYSIGFFGGSGMAYGVFTQQWEQNTSEKKYNRTIPFLLVLLIIPVVVWKESFGMERLTETYGRLISDPAAIAKYVQTLVLLIVPIIGLVFWRKRQGQPQGERSNKALFIVYFGWYILLSWLITGALVSGYRIEQYLYLANFIVIGLLLRNITPGFQFKSITARRWTLYIAATVLIVAVLAFIALHMHEPWERFNERYPVNK